MKKSLFAALLLFFTALSAMFIIGLQRNPRVLPSALEGKMLPEFALPEYASGEMKSLRDMPKEAFLLNVWGTWCPACYAELPFLKQLELPIIGINWPAGNANERQNIALFLRQMPNPYAMVLVDDEGRLITDLGVYGAPETFLVSAEGRILHRHAGELNADIWRRHFLPLLAEGQ